MGAILAGIIKGIGQHVQEKNTLNALSEQSANNEMGKAFDALAAQTNDPTEQLRLQQLAMQARATGAKKMPKLLLDQHQQIIQQMADRAKSAQSQQAQQQAQQIGQAQQVVQQGVSGPDAAQGANGPVSRAPGGIPSQLPSPGVPPPNPTSAAALPAPAAATQSQEQQAATAPLPVSGLPSPGFNGLVGPASAGARAAGMTAMAQLPARVGEIGATYGAQLQTKLAEVVQERKLRADDLQKIQPLIDDFSKNPHPKMVDYAKLEAQMSTVLGRPFTIPGMAALSRPKTLPGNVSGADAPDGQLDVNGRPLNPQAQYKVRTDDLTGEREWTPTVAMTGRVVMPDPESPTKWSVFQVDREGNVQGKTQGAAPPAAYAPVTHNGQRMQVVDFGDHKELVPVTSETSTQRTFPGMAGAPGSSPSSSLPAPAEVTPRSTATGAGGPAAAVGGFGRRSLGAKSLGPAQVLPMKNSIEVAAHQLWGDPDNPGLRPLASYAALADNPESRTRIGSALKLVLNAASSGDSAHAGASVGPVSLSAGGVGDYLQNAFGVPQKVAEQRAKMISDATAAMTTEERDYFNSLMNAIPTITGFRKLTSGGAFRWSQEGLERELPMIGLAGTNSSRDFSNKMRALGDEPLTAIKNLERTNPGVVDPRMADMIRGTKGIASPGVTPPQGRTVTMRAPNGQTSPVPADQVEHYKSLGAVVVQ